MNCLHWFGIQTCLATAFAATTASSGDSNKIISQSGTATSALIKCIVDRLARSDEVRSDSSCVTILISGSEYDRRKAPPHKAEVSKLEGALPLASCASSRGPLWPAPHRLQNLSRSSSSALQPLHCLRPTVSIVSGAYIPAPVCERCLAA